MAEKEIVKYRKPIIVLHWIHTGAYTALFLTGLILFIPALSFIADASWVRSVHRIGAAVFIIVPLAFLIASPKASFRGLKKAFTWGSADLKWLKAAPRYYLLGDDKTMPPQDKMNSGQKFWWLLTIVGGVALAATGIMMSFGITSISPGVLHGARTVHDIAFIATGIMFLLHIYLGAFHPMMNEAWKSMTRGTVSAGYARKHHSKWYDEVTGGKDD